MGLRARLALFFVVITVLPLAVAVAVLQTQAIRQTAEVEQRELSTARTGALLAVEAARGRVGDAATELGLLSAEPLAQGDVAAARRLVAERARGPLADRSDFLLLGDASGRVVQMVQLERPSFQAPAAAEILHAARTAGEVPRAIAEVREVRAGERGSGRTVGWAVAGMWTDTPLLELMPVHGAAVIDDRGVVAALGADASAVPSEDLPGDVAGGRTIDGRAVTATSVDLRPGAGGARLLLWRPSQRGVSGLGFALAILLPAMLIAATLGWILASTIAAPIRRAADTARAIASGDLEQKVPVEGSREVADLAAALNTMTLQLRGRLTELATSRDELRQSLSRLGRTLSSSLDLDRTLALVVETAMDTLGVDRAMLRLFTPERDALYVKVGRGVGRTVPRIGVGEGIAGYVARTGIPLRLPADADQAPEPADAEPEGHSQLVVPMVGRGRIIGVLTLLRDNERRQFTAEDLDTVRSFAAQASVAVENVMLHHEAQRLSVTDPLTGLWNFRYFQLQAEREMESAARFDRPLSLLIADLDHFKAINDVQGHQVGDEVLIEVAQRIQAATRVPDVVARYGGEEFVMLLPGTDAEGAHATAERIRAAVGDDAFVVAAATGTSRTLAVTCSVGAATFPAHGSTVAALLRSADAAMYAAKARGRDRVVAAPDGAPMGRGRRADGS